MTHMIKVSCIAAALVLTACGSGGDTSETAAGTPANDSVQAVVEKEIATFIPSAKQFGVKQFKLVSNLEGGPVGTRTLWVEDYGNRVGLLREATFGNFDDYYVGYWDGEKMHFRNAPDAPVQHMAIRLITTEPSSFATTEATQLEAIGYERIGDKVIAGQTCEHWKQTQQDWEGCRLNHIEFAWRIGESQNTTATEYVEGESIPAEIKDLANQ